MPAPAALQLWRKLDRPPCLPGMQVKNSDDQQCVYLDVAPAGTDEDSTKKSRTMRCIKGKYEFK